MIKEDVIRVISGYVIGVLPQVHMVIKEGAVEGDHGAPPHGWSIDRPQGAEIDGGEIGELHSRSIQRERKKRQEGQGVRGG